MVVEGEASWASDMIRELPALKFRASVSNVDVKVEPAVTVSYRDKGPKAKAMSFIQLWFLTSCTALIVNRFGDY